MQIARCSLFEAGPDDSDITNLPADVLDTSQPTVEHDWGYTADADLDRGISVPRARIMGGCSATNACFAQRGAPEDYDGWDQMGNSGWGFADVLDDFRRLTRHRFQRSMARLGWPHPDSPPSTKRVERRSSSISRRCRCVGVSIRRGPQSTKRRRGRRSPRNVKDGVRMSTAVTYLAEARNRSNLTIRPDTMVASVVHRNFRTIGIRLVDGTLIEADRVVVAGGTYASPRHSYPVGHRAHRRAREARYQTGHRSTGGRIESL